MKRVLFISYYFPPSAGSGVQRPLKFVKYLPEFGWEATVLTVDPEYAAYSDLDVSLLADIPEQSKIIRTRARDPYAAYSRFMGLRKKDAVGVGFTDQKRVGFREKCARWIRGNFFIPDARIGWIPFAVRAGLEELAAVPYDALFSTGPPHSSHLAALKIRHESSTPIPWIVDLRDAWPSDSYGHLIPSTRLATKIDHRRRSKVFDAADCITAVSKTIADGVSGLTQTPVHIVSNGFDPADFVLPDSDPVLPEGSNEFSIVFAGHMPDEQNPESLWKVLQRRVSQGDWEKLRVHLVGNISNAVLASITKHGLEEQVVLTPYVSHTDAIRWMRSASLLLLTINRVPNPDGIITGKLYEYLASGMPILCLGPVRGDAAEIIASCGAGETFGHSDESGVERMIEGAYGRWVASEPTEGASRSAADRFSRRTQTGNLARILDEISA